MLCTFKQFVVLVSQGIVLRMSGNHKCVNLPYFKNISIYWHNEYILKRNKNYDNTYMAIQTYTACQFTC